MNGFGLTVTTLLSSRASETKRGIYTFDMILPGGSGRAIYMIHKKYNCRETEGGPVFNTTRNNYKAIIFYRTKNYFRLLLKTFFLIL